MELHRVVISAVLLLASLGAPASAVESARAAPDFVLKSVSGENIRLSEYRGRIVMVSFWASWCGDCRNQLRALQALQNRYAGAGVELLAVSLDTARRQAADAADALELATPVLLDPDGAVGRLYEVDRMPYAVLVDREGQIRHIDEGFGRNSAADYLAQIKNLLRE